MKVLISIRSLEELDIALQGDPDIIDLKEPNEGSLGATLPWIISETKKKIKTKFVSAAIGDIPNLPGTAALASLGATVSGADYVKVGLKGPKTSEDAIFLLKKVVKAAKSYNPNVIIVGAGYADYNDFDGINPLDIPEIVKKSNADISMIDTLNKSKNKCLFDFLDLKKLSEFVDKSHILGIEAALAGSLRSSHISNLLKINTDIIGFRGAICEQNDRKNGKISLQKIDSLMKNVRNLDSKSKNSEIIEV